MFAFVPTVYARWFLPALCIGALLSSLIGPLGLLLLVPPPPVFAQSILELARWESNMLTYGSLHCKLASLGDVYYDAQRVYNQIADYTRDASWITCAGFAETTFRDGYVLPNNGKVPGHWNFTNGLRLDYERTGDESSKTAAVLLSKNAAFAAEAPLAWTQSAFYSREVAYAVLSYINAEALGEPRRQRRTDLLNQAYDHMEQWFVRFTWPGPWQQNPMVCDSSGHCSDRLAPFMVGLTAHTLIRDWEQTKDARLIPALRRAADWMWANAWIPRDESFWYDSYDRSVGAPDLNLLIAPIYGFLYRQTGEAKYRDQGDAVFAGGARRAWLGDGKQFDQNYWWSFDFVKWRTTLSADTTPPIITMTAPLNGTTVSGTVAVSATATDNVAVIGVQFKLDGANLGAEDTTAPYTLSWNTASASSGVYVLSAVARDAAGNRATSAAVSVTSFAADTTPPMISGVSVMSITSSGAGISWTTNEPSDSQVEYGVTASYGSTTPMAGDLVTARAVTLSGLASGTTYHFRVKSKDASKNLATSGDFTFMTSTILPAPETAPPMGAITAPTLGWTVSGIITVSANVSDNVGVAGVQFKLDGADLGSEVTAAPYAVSWNSALVPNGPHTLTAVARDLAGNIATLAAVSVTVANNPDPPEAVPEASPSPTVPTAPAAAGGSSLGTGTDAGGASASGSGGGTATGGGTSSGGTSSPGGASSSGGGSSPGGGTGAGSGSGPNRNAPGAGTDNGAKAGTPSAQPPRATSPLEAAQSPFKGAPFSVPGTFQAEDFDNGGEGIAYHDLSAGNQQGRYRRGVDVDISSPYAKGYVISSFQTGEWLEYTITVATSGTYRIELLVSSKLTTSRFHIEIDEVDRTGPMSVPNTGSWRTFQWVGRSGLTLTAGRHVLRVHADQQYFNLDAVRIVIEAGGVPTPSALSAPSKSSGAARASAGRRTEPRDWITSAHYSAPHTGSTTHHALERLLAAPRPKELDTLG